MRVRLNIGLDFDGNHTFEWQASNDPGAVDIPRTTLERWAAEREAFTVAYLRWRRIMEEIEHGNEHFGKWETIKKIGITPEVWSVDNDLLTPTFKPKREVILKRYKHLYDRIYG